MYGTTFDVNGMGFMLRALPAIGAAKEPALNAMWRSKQLEYTFRRSTMDCYVPLTSCTRQALDFCCDALDARLTETERVDLCSAYLRLPAFPDCRPGLEALKARGHRCVAFSNGTQKDVTSLIASANLQYCFEDRVVVVDDMPRPVFKPSPEVYHFLTSQAESSPDDTWLVSSNPFDVIGAAHVGWKTVWMKRGGKPNYVFDPWPDAKGPTAIVSSFKELPDVVMRHS
eukprot:CAMPEP_0203874908 /NCGR_PEP_ID=MMETSP0359-20131031/20535_1 /ASSEMBLY_ACC=CAM_ASM_000338 /TAXON_ID=268821 /ORGANISM="Scrippsiella Hangoei, Strain SHTV-5" /LENGTH=227 /DNA_ID=CAMNT_0050793697 /DNA_START=150 /DNA_END=833 /DNA_ORIENTATION=+